MPVGSVGYENATNERGERYVWLAPNVVDRLKALRDPGDSYSDVSCAWRRRSRRTRSTALWRLSEFPKTKTR